MVYLGIITFLVGLWQSFMKGKYSPIISRVLLIFGAVFVFIGNWQLGVFFIFFFVSWWLLMQVFRFSICHNYFLKTIPILIGYAFLIDFLLKQFSFPYSFSWYACLTIAFLYINHKKQYEYKEFFKIFSNKENGEQAEVELSFNRTIKYYFLSSLVFIGSLILASFLLSSQNDPRGITASHVINAINYKNQATIIINSDKESSVIRKNESDAMFKFYNNALSEAKMADIALMNEHFPGFGDHFEQEFIKGLEMILDGHKSGDVKKSINGQLLGGQWTKWYNENFDKIQKKGG
ncbi:MAG: hypothetical protein L6420_03440 [Elusimicrobia bacterium]|nr:hypothetical protein [Elusimicrobiota bacterium]